jgi:hypothetical protein
MKAGKIMVLGLAVMAAMALTGEAMARGGNGGGSGNGNRQGVHTSTTAQTTTTRPADSQRRDGTFLTTGTTASGSTTRPANGNGLRDGSRLTTTTVPVPPVVTAP